MFYFGMHFLFLFGQTFAWPLTNIITYCCCADRKNHPKSNVLWMWMMINGMILGLAITIPRLVLVRWTIFHISFLVDAESICNTSFNSYQSIGNNNKNNNLRRWCIRFFFSLSQREWFCMTIILSYIFLRLCILN